VALGISTYPSPYTIDSEVVNVVGGGSARSITVQRGVGGTTKAAHVNGTALTAANAFSGGGGGVTVTDGTTTVAATSLSLVGASVTDEGGGVAGVALLTRRIGPFHLLASEWPDPYAATGQELATIPAGTFIVCSEVLPTIPWYGDASTEVSCTLNLSAEIALSTKTKSILQADLYNADVDEVNDDLVAHTAAKTTVAGGNHTGGALTVVESTLIASIYSDDYTNFQGEADVYLFLAEPVA